MSAKIIGIAVAALIVVGGGAAYVLTQNNDDQKTASTTQKKNPFKDPETDVYNGDLLDITAAGKARTCSFNTTIEDVTTNGTLYTDGRGRGYMEMIIENVGTSNALVQDDKIYGWTTTGGSTTGFTYTKAEVEKLASDAGIDTQTNSSVSSVNQPFNMKCTGWKVDDAKFVAPTNVNFVSVPNRQE